MKKEFSVLLICLGFAGPAWSGDPGMLDGALNASFRDREEVQKSYRKNNVGAPKKASELTDNRIRIEVGGEIGTVTREAHPAHEEGFQFRPSQAANEEIKVDVEKELIDTESAGWMESHRNPGSFPIKARAR